MRFRNNGVANFFADVHGGVYIKGGLKVTPHSTSQEYDSLSLRKKRCTWS